MSDCNCSCDAECAESICNDCDKNHEHVAVDLFLFKCVGCNKEFLLPRYKNAVRHPVGITLYCPLCGNPEIVFQGIFSGDLELNQETKRIQDMFS